MSFSSAKQIIRKWDLDYEIKQKFWDY